MERIRDLRKAQGLTLEDLASRAETAVSHLSNIERGLKDPSVKLLRSIADALGSTPADLQSPKPADGFAEPEVAPLDMSRLGNTHPGLTLELMAPNAGHPMPFLLSSKREAFGLLPGSFLVIDNKQAATDGDIVVANIIDPMTGEPYTKIGRFVGAVLIGPDIAKSATDFVRLDGVDHTIYGPVVASMWGVSLE